MHVAQSYIMLTLFSTTFELNEYHRDS